MNFGHVNMFVVSDVLLNCEFVLVFHENTASITLCTEAWNVQFTVRFKIYSNKETIIKNIMLIWQHFVLNVLPSIKNANIFLDSRRTIIFDVQLNETCYSIIRSVFQ